MISLTQLLAKTSEFHPNLVINKKEFRFYINLSLMTKGQLDFADNVLYLGFASMVGEKASYIDNATLFLVGDCCISDNSFASENMVIVEYPPEIDIFRLFNFIKAFFYQDWEFLNNSSMLLNAFLNSNSLDDLAETAAGLVQNPVMVMDASYKVLAYSKLSKIEDILWLQTLEMGSFTSEYISAIRPFNSSVVIPKGNQPYHLKTNMSPTRWLIIRLYAHSVHLGYLVTLEANQLFQIDSELYKLISDVIAKTIKSDKALHSQKDYMTFESILVDLINGNITNKSIFFKNIKEVNFGHGSSFQLICLKISNYSHSSASDNYLKYTLEAILPKIWSFHYNDHILILVEMKKKASLSALEQTSLETLFERNNLFAGVSDVFTDLLSLSLYYRQAVRALEISKFLQTPGRIFEYENFKFHDIVLSLSTEDKEMNCLKNYCSSTLIKIQAYDRIHSTEYLKTLWIYLNSNKNLIKTAKKLYIHKNTAAYRIQRLEELFAIKMDDDFMLFKFYYSYLLLSCADC